MNQEMIRARYEGLLKSFGNEVVAEPSKIRIEVPLKDGVGQYRIPIKKTVENLREKSLDRNDVFVPNYMGVFFGFQVTGKESAMKMYPFAPQVGTGKIAQEGFTTSDPNALYNGTLTWQVDSQLILSAYPTENFKKVPETQGAVIYDGEELVNIGEQVEYTIQDACELVIPRILVAGTRDHVINVNFDAANLSFAAEVDGEDATPVLVFYLDGFLIKNGCEKGIGIGTEVSDVTGTW